MRVLQAVLTLSLFPVLIGSYLAAVVLYRSRASIATRYDAGTRDMKQVLQRRFAGGRNRIGTECLIH